MSHRTAKTVLVAGATGRFGAIVELLLAKGHRVRAATRKPDGTAATRLRSVGAEVVQADFDEPETLARAAAGVDAVFASGDAHRVGPQAEVKHGQNLAHALAEAKTPHLVFVSGAGADGPTGVPVLEAKRAVERRLGSHDIPVTIIAPVYFMENLFNPWNRGPLRAGTLPMPVPLSESFQQVAIADVLTFAVLMIERPDEFAGERIELAGDQPTGWEAAAALSMVVGRTIEAGELSREGLHGGLDLLFDWLARNPRPVDIPGLHARFDKLAWHSFERWTRSQADFLRKLTAPGQPAIRQ